MHELGGLFGVSIMRTILGHMLFEEAVLLESGLLKRDGEIELFRRLGRVMLSSNHFL